MVSTRNKVAPTTPRPTYKPVLVEELDFDATNPRFGVARRHCLRINFNSYSKKHRTMHGNWFHPSWKMVSLHTNH